MIAAFRTPRDWPNINKEIDAEKRFPCFSAAQLRKGNYWASLVDSIAHCFEPSGSKLPNSIYLVWSCSYGMQRKKRKPR